MYTHKPKVDEGTIALVAFTMIAKAHAKDSKAARLADEIHDMAVTRLRDEQAAVAAELAREAQTLTGG